MENRVIEILPEIKPNFDEDGNITIRKKRVAAYARVSTDFEDQLNSFENQKKTYMAKISENASWEFVDLYSDEGITGTSLKNREGFKNMIKDALEGKIDLILVKSISRFARNTVDCIKTKRELQEKGVEIYFEKENISSLDGASETMLTIYASFAQEESRQISTNVTWGIRSRMKEGTYRSYSKGVLGYKVTDDNKLEIDPVGKETVKLIFEMFMDGLSYRDIVAKLKNEGHLTVTGKTNWDVGLISRILSNEKYCGDIIYQKTYCKNYLTHEREINDNKISQFFIPAHHESIISKEKFMYVQLLRKERNESYVSTLDNGRGKELSGLVYCACCGRTMHRVEYARGTKSHRYVLSCKMQSRKKINFIQCKCKNTIDYDTLKALLIELVNKETKEIDVGLLERAIIQGKAETAAFAEIAKVKADIDVWNSKLHDLVKESTNANISIADYKSEFQKIQNKIFKLKEKLEELNNTFKETCRNEIFNKELMEFLKENKSISSRIVHSVFKRIYRLEDNSLLLIKSKRTLSPEELESIRKNSTAFMVLVSNEFQKDKHKIIYRILDLEDEDENRD
ncbi:MAG: recombinase family protein [Bacilli bacterium]|nr:recombinase family protein [Bacilli bacterium]